MATSRATYVRRRRNAILAAAVLAVILIVVIIIIIVGIAKRGTSSVDQNVSTVTTPLPTPVSTISAYNDDPFEEEFTTPEPSEEPSNVMFVTGSTVNVRKTASASGEKVTSVVKGTKVTVGEESNGFIAVTLENGTTGFISKDYLAKESQSTASDSPTTAGATPDTSKATKMYATADGLNVRDAASSSGKSVAKLSKGASVTAYSLSGDWYYVQYATGKYGYVSKTYLSTTAPAKATSAPATATPTPAPKTAITDWSQAGINVTWGEGTSLQTRENYRQATGAQTPNNLGNHGGASAVYGLKKLDGTTYYVAVVEGKASIYISLDNIPGTPAT